MNAHNSDTRRATSIEHDEFGTLPDGRVVWRHSLGNARGIEVRIIDHGGIVTSINVPDRHGRVADVTTGYDTLEGYLRDTAFFGALIGRYANRIGGARYVIDGRESTLAPNDGRNQLHGGRGGFHTRLWRAEALTVAGAAALELRLESPAGDQGHPGRVEVSVRCALTDENELAFDFTGVTDAPTHLSLTQHSYFNLAGDAAGDIDAHELRIGASRFTPVNDDLTPTGELRDVAGTPFDFRTPVAVGSRIASDDEQLTKAGGYDHNFVLERSQEGLQWAARVRDPGSGRTLDIFTTEPGMQFYSGNHLDGIVGKRGRRYLRRAALALEGQHFPDSPNNTHFPSTLLTPGMPYRSRIVYRFGVEA
jgi:aldose 1-epimerase